jgi:hypothetical protein
MRRKTTIKERVEEAIENNVSIIAVLAVLFSVGTFLFVTYFLYKDISIEEIINKIKKDPFGDTFNGIAAPFLMLGMAVLTFLAFYAQIIFNKKQLEFNKSLMEFNERQELASGFFDFYNLHLKILDTLTFETTNGGQPASYNGKHYFKALYNELVAYFNELNVKKPDGDNALYAYLRLFNDQQNYLGPYFSSLFHLFRFIDKEADTLEAKHQYFDFLSSSLSQYELGFLYYNFKTDYSKALKEILERNKYNIFNRFDESFLPGRNSSLK